jgi:putative serine protease PepD
MWAMTSPKHLWSGDWRRESDAAEPIPSEPASRPEHPLQDEPTRVQATIPPPPPPQAPPTRSFRQPEPQPQPEEPRKGKGGRIAAVGAVAVLLVGGAFAVGSIVSGGDGNKASTTAALPAISNKPLKPKTGQTREAAIYAKASPAVVSIRTDSGSGTGFLIDKAGTIVTNAHVVDTAKTVQVKFGADGEALNGTVKGVDASTDLAVVSIPSSGIPSGTQPLGLADSRNVNIGDEVIAIGNPFGLDRTETSGIVSGTARNIQAPNGYTISEAIQTDAAINPGNSGGPLLNSAAEVIGVNSQIETGGAGSNGNVGIGFAVSSNTVRQVVPGLKEGKEIEHAWLGVSIGGTAAGSQSATGTGTATSGAVIGDVTAGGPAARAGLQAGDVVTELDGQAIHSATDLTTKVNNETVGKEIEVTVLRSGKKQTVKLTIGTRPSTPAASAQQGQTP